MPAYELSYPRKVQVNDITVRDGFQHEEIWIPTDAKLFYLEELILCGIKHLEVTNFGNPALMPQFKDSDELFKRLRDSKKLSRAGVNWNDVTLTAITIREKSVDRAIVAKQEGWGPDRVLMMVSTDEQHHFANSGTTLPNYWDEAKRCIEKTRAAGIKMCGTVSTIWGSPISGPTELSEAVEFTKRWLDIGASDIEHADHDGSAPPDQVYRYFSMILDEIPDKKLHIAHFHVTRGWGLANVLAALQAGIEIFEGTLGGLGGQPANFLDRVPVGGTGAYYYRDPNVVGLQSIEDMAVMMDEMKIDTGIDVDRLLDLGSMMEKTIGRRLRSESILNRRIPKAPREEFKRKGLEEIKKKLGEAPGQKFPADWPEKSQYKG
ncbi:pyruvate carboxyltransferase [Desulfomonile tiedjei]|uniref:Isopropylmalate/homocitrate/citramalate synthase n=1 Tax=Desulfomonile tiedjei (strain ATCC 49306 / DSM 6799 / DCB-1) TaxID=706587 RepID=I4C7M4_DESTA|nr:pyruvate carboxyltransferase [Desulfomonile tiedjei]AFM25565.1 isopropylmalate/homocitrate/citramalate synthase [Desulfomonile tiedjei DSM 6799]